MTLFPGKTGGAARRAAALLRVLLQMLLCSDAIATSCLAQDQIGNYQHSRWKAENGVPADIRSMAQTVDGWLFLGTSAGLVRFDGLHFERVAGPLGHLRIQELYAAPNGDLYVSGYDGPLSVLHPDGRTEQLPDSDGPALGPISAIAFDADGGLWVIGWRIYHWDGARWQAVDADPVWRTTAIRSLALDRDGTLWAAHDKGVKRLVRGARGFEPVDDHGGSLVLAPDDAVWLLPKDGAQVRRLAQPSAAHTRFERANPSGSRFAGLFDATGALWKLRCPEPVCIAYRKPAAPLKTAVAPAFDERLGAAAQLSGVDARQILEDREGDIWIATQRGLDRFRPTRLTQSGLPGTGAGMTMAADADGRIWVADETSGALWEMRADGAPRRVPGPPVTMVVPDRQGGVLLAGHRSIWRQAHGRRTEIPLPPGADGKPVDRTLLRLVDDGKYVWAAAPDIVLMAWSDGTWRSWTTFNMELKIYLLVPGAPGQMWLGWAGGQLVSYDNDKRTHYDAGAVGFITGIFPGEDKLVVGGDAGLGVLVAGQLRMLHAADPDVLRGISGLLVTPSGDRWMNGAAGIIHVRAEDWRHALAQPQEALRYELFDAIDGYPGRAVVETATASAVSADGRLLWFIGTEGIVSLDTRTLYRNAVRPTPVLEGVFTPHGAAAGLPVRIGADIDRFSLRFTAPSLRLPERVRFEYRLDGFDRDWQEAGLRRLVEYTNIPPGAYRFRLRAFNEDGLRSAGEAALPLRVEPALTQTLWFRALAAMLVLVLVSAAYRYRVHYLTARLTERLRVKTGERERIARTLHDSFLQSLQSLLMRLDAVAAKLPEDAVPRRELEIIRDQANDAIVEGRDHVTELRSGDALELGAVIARSIELLRPDAGGAQFVLQVDGERRSLPGAIADEVGDIAREALRNAAQHAHARSIRVALGYGRRALTLSVADDGRGLDDEVARTGARPGHWGLTGMRERAARIGALLTIDSRPGLGTTVRLALPAKRAYAD